MNKKRKINWPAYNKQLVQRGSLTFLFSEDVAHNGIISSLKVPVSKESIQIQPLKFCL